MLLTKYAPSCVVVNQELEILQFRGSTNLFLEASPGKASLNLLRMAKPSLAFELRNAIHKASKTNGPVRKSDLEIKVDKAIRHVAIEVSMIQTKESEEKLFLVIFQELEAPVVPDTKNFSKDKLVRQLQDELRTVK